MTMSLNNPGIKNRVILGGLWILAFRGFSGLLAILQVFFLTRLLLPADFGLFGIVSIIMAALVTFSETGFEVALIQKDEDIRAYMDSALIVQAARGFCLSIIMIIVSPIAAWFFHEPAVRLLIYVMALSPLIMGFKNVGMINFQKELLFSKILVFESIVAIISFIVGITAALVLRNAWALVALSLARAISSVVVSYAVHPFRPRFNFDSTKVRTLFQYGRWVLGTKIMKFLILQGDALFVGRLLGTVSLGFYNRANKISNLPVTYIGNTFSQILFPAYAKIQGDLSRLRNAWLETTHFRTFLTIPVSGIIFILAPEVVNIVLTPEWAPVIPALRILCALSIMRTIGDTEGLFRAIGKPGLSTKITALRLVLIFSAIMPLISRFGLSGAAAAVSLGTFVSLIVAVMVACRTVDCSLIRFLLIIMRPMTAMLVMVLIVGAMRSAVCTQAFTSLILLILLGFISYLAGSILLDLIMKDMKLKRLAVTLWTAIRQRSG